MTEPQKPQRNVLLLGIVSLLNDIGSEIIQPILPLFIQSFGGGGMAVGLIGGISDGIPSLLKIFSGYWSDRIGRRKPLVFAGYFLSVVSKLLMALATAWQHVFILKSLERTGKGIRTAPRDAIIAASSDEKSRGRSFGIHRALDTSGAVVGSALAFILWQRGMGFGSIIAVAGIISIVALAPLVLVKDVAKSKAPNQEISISCLSPDLRKFVSIASIFALGNISYMFFLLKAGPLFSGNWATGAPILLYLLFNIVYAVFSFPIGIWSDKVGKKTVLMLGYALFAVVAFGFAYVSTVSILVLLFVLYGLVFAMVDGAERAYVSDLSKECVRGTVLGVYHGLVGMSALLSGVMAGVLWEEWSARAAFLFASLLGLIATLLLFGMVRNDADYNKTFL